MGAAPQLEVDAKMMPVSFSVDETALIVVDMQHDFVNPQGMFGSSGIDVSGAQAVIEPIARVLPPTRAAGIRVVYLKMALLPDLSDSGGEDGPSWLHYMRVGSEVTAPDGRPSRVLIRDTWNTDIVDELAPEPEDTVIYKHRFNGFFETELDATLRGWGVKNLVFTGCTTSVCVESTIREASFRNYHNLLLTDCTAESLGDEFPRTNYDASLLVIQTLFGSTAESSAYLAGISRLPVATSS